MNEKKICPFMNRGIPGTHFCFYCIEEKCMAWDVIREEIAEDGSDIFEFYGCKLIERPE